MTRETVHCIYLFNDKFEIQDGRQGGLQKFCQYHEYLA